MLCSYDGSVSVIRQRSAAFTVDGRLLNVGVIGYSSDRHDVETYVTPAFGAGQVFIVIHVTSRNKNNFTEDKMMLLIYYIDPTLIID